MIYGKIWTSLFAILIRCLKCSDGMEDGVDPDLTPDLTPFLEHSDIRLLGMFRLKLL